MHQTAFQNRATFFSPPRRCLQTAAQYQVGGGKELNRISYISQVRQVLARMRPRYFCGLLPAQLGTSDDTAAARNRWPGVVIPRSLMHAVACMQHCLSSALLQLRASQVKARPPTFVVWVRGSAPLSVTATRFIAGQIRKQFGFSGVPLRIQVRQKQPRRADKARRK